jgi:PadR family transcriptional regulator PadR
MDLNNWQSQLRKGLLDTVILNLLRHGRCHGYEMVQTLKQIKGLKIREGNIYPILARLETDELATCSQEPSEDGPPRKYYKLTKLGEKTIAEMNWHWDQITESIQIIRKGLHR